MSPQLVADIRRLVDEHSPADLGPRWHGRHLKAGDRVTVRSRFAGPVTLTVRRWGKTRDGQPWVAGNRRSALVSDVLVVERDGERL